MLFTNKFQCFRFNCALSASVSGPIFVHNLLLLWPLRVDLPTPNFPTPAGPLLLTLTCFPTMFCTTIWCHHMFPCPCFISSQSFLLLTLSTFMFLSLCFWQAPMYLEYGLAWLQTWANIASPFQVPCLTSPCHTKNKCQTFKRARSLRCLLFAANESKVKPILAQKYIFRNYLVH